MHKLMTYTEPLITFLFTLIINIAWASVFSIMASGVVIIRTLYLVKRDIDRNHRGKTLDWVKSFKKKQ